MRCTTHTVSVKVLIPRPKISMANPLLISYFSDKIQAKGSPEVVVNGLIVLSNIYFVHLRNYTRTRTPKIQSSTEIRTKIRIAMSG